jgi:hydrogenase maturation protease
MPRALIIAYGNPLRSDDGVAWRAAEVLRQKFSPAEVEIACLHQLAPELAETVSRFPCVIFVDAASSPHAGHPGEIRVQELSRKDSSDSGSPLSHALSPNAVMRLSDTLYDAKPRAFAVTVSGQNFDHGESLSSAVAAALPDLVAQIQGLVSDPGKGR